MTDWKNSFEDQQEKTEANRHPIKDNNEPIRFEIVERIAVLSINESGWQKELNLISWNGAEPKYDIRSWKDDYTRAGKGVTLFEDEMRVLKESLKRITFSKKKEE